MPTDEKRILVVSNRSEDKTQLGRIFANSEWPFDTVNDIAAALEYIRERRPWVVITARMLPDGTWTAIRDAVTWCAAAPEIIVTDPHADDSLWAEALNLGALDVLAQPFSTLEVLRVTSMAMIARARRPMHPPHTERHVGTSHAPHRDERP